MFMDDSNYVYLVFYLYREGYLCTKYNIHIRVVIDIS